MTVETTKVSRVHLTTSLVEQVEGKFALNLGKNEVAELLAIYQHANMAAVDHVIRYGVYRKSDSAPVLADHDATSEDNNWILISAIHSGAATYLGPIIFDKMIKMPPGIVLVRSPRLVVESLQAILVVFVLTLYYRVKTVSNDELAKLMVKYHS